MTISSFSELGLIEPILRALRDEKHEQPTPIQAQAIPHAVQGRDILGCAQTGTGKTAAFAIPILQRLTEGKRQGQRNAPRALILTPTRELAEQINTSVRAYGRHLKLWQAVVYGGVGMGGQIKAISRGADILVATPGRLLDLMRQRVVSLGSLEIFVLDEADRMLDMGFITDVTKIISALPSNRQTMFFSATMPPAVTGLAGELLNDPVSVKVNPVSSTAEKVEQKVMFVERHDKEAALLNLLKDEGIFRALIFTRTKHKANNIAEKLNRNMVSAEAIHGNKSQAARMKALKNFSAGRARVLVATDIASRGIDIKGVTHVINFEMPNEPESYVHRIGRTARAGEAGSAISLCDSEERSILRAIERVIRIPITVDEDHPHHSAQVAAPRQKEPRNYGGYNRNSRFKPRNSGAGYRPSSGR
ncbi:MAG: DEAD/DEAH box helicase [Nitrospinae bacterium]|nr:DEAD/DEAH box helicase [Nitrospinota bacterium]